MLRLLIFGLAIYALYIIFIKDKTIIIKPKDKNRKKNQFTDYEEIN
jgi:hypothetical protein